MWETRSARRPAITDGEHRRNPCQFELFGILQSFRQRPPVRVQPIVRSGKSRHDFGNYDLSSPCALSFVVLVPLSVSASHTAPPTERLAKLFQFFTFLLHLLF